jgi:hypothetical protein
MDNLNNRSEQYIHNIPAEIAAEIRSIGKVFNEDVAQKTKELYMPILRGIDRNGINIIRDISYGAHERNILDIHMGVSGASDMPAVIFFMAAVIFVVIKMLREIYCTVMLLISSFAME